MIRSKRIILGLYPQQLRRLFCLSSCCLIAGIAFSLSGCQPYQIRGQLVAREEWDTSVDVLKANGRSNYVRKFECLNVNEVAIRFVHINSGMKHVISDEKYRRAAGSKSSTCWFWLHTRSNTSEGPRAEFIFSENKEINPPRNASVDQPSQNASADFYIAKDADPTQYRHWVSAPPMGTEIRKKESVFVYWYGAIPSQYSPDHSDFLAAIEKLKFSSEQEIEKFSGDHKGSIFWVVTIEPIK